MEAAMNEGPVIEVPEEILLTAAREQNRNWTEARHPRQFHFAVRLPGAETERHVVPRTTSRPRRPRWAVSAKPSIDERSHALSRHRIDLPGHYICDCALWVTLDGAALRGWLSAAKVREIVAKVQEYSALYPAGEDLRNPARRRARGPRRRGGRDAR
jgi:hypothetical protein